MTQAKVWQGGQWQEILIFDGTNMCQARNGKNFRIDEDGNLDTGTYKFRIYSTDAKEYTGGNYKPQSEAK